MILTLLSSPGTDGPGLLEYDGILCTRVLYKPMLRCYRLPE